MLDYDALTKTKQSICFPVNQCPKYSAGEGFWISHRSSNLTMLNGGKRDFTEIFMAVFCFSVTVIACVTDETKLRLNPSTKHRQNPCSGPPSMRHAWVRAMIGRVCYKTTSSICHINLEENSKRTPGNSLSRVGAGPEEGSWRCFAAVY